MIRFLLRLATSKPVTMTYPREATPPERGLRRTPTLDADRCKLTGACQEACPTNAIQTVKRPAGDDSWQLDYGLCIFCGACIQACPEGAIAPSDVFQLAVRQRDGAVATHEVRTAR